MFKDKLKVVNEKLNIAIFSYENSKVNSSV